LQDKIRDDQKEKGSAGREPSGTAQRIQPSSPQQPTHRDQRQADQGRRIVRVHPRQQGDPERLHLGAACTVVRLLALKIGFDLLIRQRAEVHFHGFEHRLGKAVGGTTHGHGRVKPDRTATHGAQLLCGARMVTGLAQRPAFEVGHLV